MLGISTRPRYVFFTLELEEISQVCFVHLPFLVCEKQKSIVLSISIGM